MAKKKGEAWLCEHANESPKSPAPGVRCGCDKTCYCFQQGGCGKARDLRPPVAGSTPLTPAVIKLASALVHLDEYTSPQGHPFDLDTARHLMQDEDVKDLLNKLDSLSLIPMRRDGKKY